MTNEKIFKAMVVSESEAGDFSHAITERKVNELPDGDVLIKVGFSSLNYKDALSISGNKGVTRNYPHTPGIDAAGVVEDSSSPLFKPGQEVLVTGYDLGMNTSGGFGEYIRVPEEWVVTLPRDMSLEKSMTYGTAGFTAAISIYKLIANGVKPDAGPILVTGATGGVGSVAVAILSKLGYQVYGSSNKPDAADFLKSLGAVDAIDRSETNDETGKPLLKPRWAAVVDTVGGNVLSTAIRSTEYGGTVTTCGNVAGADFKANVYPFILRGVSLLGVDSVQLPNDLRIKIWNHLSSDWDVDVLENMVKRVKLEDLDPYVDTMLKGRSQGRILVIL